MKTRKGGKVNKQKDLKLKLLSTVNKDPVSKSIRYILNTFVDSSNCISKRSRMTA